MPFPGFDDRDRNVTGKGRSDLLRNKLDQFGRETVRWGQANPSTADLFKHHYVTQKNDHTTQWVGIYPVPFGGDFNLQSAFAHAHLVIPQNRPEDLPWLGINIEFQGPRQVASDKLDPQGSSFQEALQAVGAAQGAQLSVYKKSVLRNDHQHYQWNGLLDSAHEPLPVERVSKEDLKRVRNQLRARMPSHPEANKIWEPILLLERRLRSEEFNLPGQDFVKLTQRILLTFAPFLKILRYD